MLEGWPSAQAEQEERPMPGGKARGQEGSAWWAHPAAPARTADTHTAEEGLRDQYLWVYV